MKESATDSPVESLLRERIQTSCHRRVRWRDVMDLALYEPGVGYYRQGVRTIGRGGDFFTSVSVGSVLGELLAGYCHEVWTREGQPETFAIIEQGANEGYLARDILEAVRRNHPELWDRLLFWIIEPYGPLREVQKNTLGPELAEKLRTSDGLDHFQDGTHAVFLANELLDAFPTHRVHWTGAVWEEWCVTLDEADQWKWISVAVDDPALVRELALLPLDLAPGYTTDLNLDMLKWLSEVRALPFQGTVVLLDYGLPEVEYFLPTRRAGTLRRYYRHRMDDRVLEDLGDSDLTTHVNFTRLTREAERQGFILLDFIEQGRFLTQLAVLRLKSELPPPPPEWVRQFQTLTHPNQMGMSFHALLLSKDLPLNGADRESRTRAVRRLGL